MPKRTGKKIPSYIKTNKAFINEKHGIKNKMTDSQEAYSKTKLGDAIRLKKSGTKGYMERGVMGGKYKAAIKPAIKKAMQMKALRSKIDMTGMDSNGQPKAKRGRIISSMD